MVIGRVYLLIFFWNYFVSFMLIVSCLVSYVKWLLVFYICNYIDRCKSGSNNCGGMDKNRKRINFLGIYKGYYKSR